MVMCSNCHKRVAVIFVTKYENEKKVSKGLCIKCAKEMGIPMEQVTKSGGDSRMVLGRIGEEA